MDKMYKYGSSIVHDDVVGELTELVSKYTGIKKNCIAGCRMRIAGNDNMVYVEWDLLTGKTLSPRHFKQPHTTVCR